MLFRPLLLLLLPLVLPLVLVPLLLLVVREEEGEEDKIEDEPGAVGVVDAEVNDKVSIWLL